MILNNLWYWWNIGEWMRSRPSVRGNVGKEAGTGPVGVDSYDERTEIPLLCEPVLGLPLILEK